MEDRLPPGDILLGGVLGGSWLPPAIGRLNAAAQPLNALRSQAETRILNVEQPKPESFYAAASQDASNLFFTVARNQAPHGTTGSPADPARPVNSNRIQPAFRDASGLDDGALDQLLGDDFDQLSSSTAKSGLNRGTPGITGSLDPAETLPPGSGSVSGSFPSLGQGLQGPSTPFVPDAQNGGLMGGGGGGSAQIPAGSGSTPANLITGGHFATLGNQHGIIRPYTSGAAWPSYTPPSSGGSGGGPPVDTVNSGSGGSNGGASGGINNSGNGTSYVNELTGTGLESFSGQTAIGDSSGSSNTADCPPSRNPCHFSRLIL